MNFITIILLFLLLILCYKVSKHILSPAVITTFIWFAIILIYNIVAHNLYPLSDHFYWIVLVWNIGFSLTSLFFSKVKIRYAKVISLSYNSNLGNKFLWLMCICLCISIYGLYIIGSNLNPGNVFAGIRQNSVSVLNGEESTIILPIYIQVAQAIATYAIIVIGSIYSFRNKRNKLVILGLLLLCIFTIFKSNKLSVVQLLFFFIVIIILKKGLSKKILISFISIFIIMMLAAHLMRAGEDKASSFDLGKMLAVYLLSPLPAFDIVSTGNVNLIQDFKGEYTFRAFIPYINLLGYNLEGNNDPFNLHFWTYTPLPVNVYTILFSFYIDFGIWGVYVFSMLYGCFYGILWNGCKKNIPMFQIAYASCFYILIFQFFADYMFQFFWINALTLIFIFFFFTHFTVGQGTLKH